MLRIGAAPTRYSYLSATIANTVSDLGVDIAAKQRARLSLLSVLSGRYLGTLGNRGVVSNGFNSPADANGRCRPALRPSAARLDQSQICRVTARSGPWQHRRMIIGTDSPTALRKLRWRAHSVRRALAVRGSQPRHPFIMGRISRGGRAKRLK